MICLSVHSFHLYIRSDKLITVDKRSGVWKTWTNVYLMRLTVTLFNSLSSTEWFFFSALSRRASGRRQTWWSRTVFELHGPETMFQLSASVQAWIWSLSTTESVRIQLMRPPERQQKKEKVRCSLFDAEIPLLLHVPKWGLPLGTFWYRCQRSLFALVCQYVRCFVPMSPQTALNIPRAVYRFPEYITTNWNQLLQPSVKRRCYDTALQRTATESCLD